MKYTKPLSSHQQKVFAAFEEPDLDYDIAVIYMHVYGYPGNMSARTMQQKLAPAFSEINKKLGEGRIEPGETKRTYRYSTIEV